MALDGANNKPLLAPNLLPPLPGAAGVQGTQGVQNLHQGNGFIESLLREGHHRWGDQAAFGALRAFLGSVAAGQVPAHDPRAIRLRAMHGKKAEAQLSLLRELLDDMDPDLMQLVGNERSAGLLAAPSQLAHLPVPTEGLEARANASVKGHSESPRPQAGTGEGQAWSGVRRQLDHLWS